MLTEYSPRSLMHDFRDFRRRMDSWFGSSQENDMTWPFNSLSGSLPASNIWENKNAYFIEMAAPGVSEQQVSLSMVGNELTIQIDHPVVDETEKNGRYWRQERVSQSSSSMSITLPGVIDAKDISANLHNGVLLIQVPKSEENQTKKICVNRCKKGQIRNETSCSDKTSGECKKSE